MVKKNMWCTVVLVVAMLTVFAVPVLSGTEKSGEALFKQHCAVCHPDGGNIVNPEKTLQKKDREKNNVRTAADIIQRMRKPGPGMSQFDQKTIPDKDAKEIAEYVLKTFNK